MAGSITTEDREFVEVWEHISPQEWGIITLDARGEERHEIVRGRRNFRITTEERMITQDRIKKVENDPFLNGSFRPVTVPDSVTIESNPNALSDEEIRRILDSESAIAWQENLKTIDSVATLRRMLEIAEDSDISIRRFRELEARLDEVRGQVRITSDDPALQRFLSGKASPDAGANTVAAGTNNPRRRVGGMSSDYR